eukprot:CAMPEP_0203923492 /NCGR_PEP_ID=MMETSP0359-20131031/63382_1 /ASSEMBLY_ACC=CAM_ASM_000338 /TAXON_ID=268821 /ORGANISM="Scrippsiella Hangoei, Strain SHTV-5" /LENGTH=646 /DNA_ID=CAMNT_0050851575 /DNA_START=6 /DNA_END=1946 /DNA_ORIENTATION=-
MEQGKHIELCEAAWASLAECVRLLENTTLRGAIPLLYAELTLEEFSGHQAAAVGATLAGGGRDGLAIAQALADASAALALTLQLAAEAIAAGLPSAAQWSQIAVQRLEHKLRALLPLVLAGDSQAFEVSLRMWSPETFLASADFGLFWQEHFSQCLRVASADFANALRTSRSMDVGACQELLTWLRSCGRREESMEQAEEVELVDMAVLFDCLGMACGVAFCTRWQELVGHSLITAIAGEHELGRRSIQCAADVVMARREQVASVLLKGWSREKLRNSRVLLRALTALGMSVACDAEEGLVVQFAEPEVATCLVTLASESRGAGRTKLAEGVAAMAQAAGLQEVDFEFAGERTPSKCAVAHVLQEYTSFKARDRHVMLTELSARKLWTLNDFLSVLKVLADRRRSAAQQRVITCDAIDNGDGHMRFAQAMREVATMEEELTARRKRLERMERAYDDPDQVAHIRALMQEVGQAEEEQEQRRTRIKEQADTWTREATDFEEARQLRDQVCRQRIAALLLETKLRHLQRLAVRSEVTRIENLLLDLEESFSCSRQRLHEYDERLTTAIQDKESLLVGLMQAMAVLKGQVREADATTMERARELESLRRIMELQANKAQQLDEIDALEKKVDILKSKNMATAAAAVVSS